MKQTSIVSHMRSSFNSHNINTRHFFNSYSVKCCISFIKLVTMKILCLIALLHVVATDHTFIYGIWTFIELYYDEVNYIEEIQYDNCVKLLVSKSNRKCECFRGDQPLYKSTTTYNKKKLTAALSLVKSYSEIEKMNFKNRFNDENCTCTRDIFLARVLNKNYMVIYEPAKPFGKLNYARPSVVLMARKIPMEPQEIKYLEANNEEMYNRSSYILCSIINRQFYFN